MTATLIAKPASGAGRPNSSPNTLKAARSQSQLIPARPRHDGHGRVHLSRCSTTPQRYRLPPATTHTGLTWYAITGGVCSVDHSAGCRPYSAARAPHGRAGERRCRSSTARKVDKSQAGDPGSASGEISVRRPSRVLRHRQRSAQTPVVEDRGHRRRGDHAPGRTSPGASKWHVKHLLGRSPVDDGAAGVAEADSVVELAWHRAGGVTAGAHHGEGGAGAGRSASRSRTQCRKKGSSTSRYPASWRPPTSAASESIAVTVCSTGPAASSNQRSISGTRCGGACGSSRPGGPRQAQPTTSPSAPRHIRTVRSSRPGRCQARSPTCQ
ncbi:hypothetical protein SAMN05421748_122150 [Paractinoplanes atraurantiacus]|uniref:Uncharacterized protein n=1 Tax=Paractinoplanes atraurantiacus TaxID=1036182 RepID=A0A285JNH3_9ACTN|nr:hypothetical protein SAMN05421748_122150 [Actinoplanes atraurantiacus]